MKQTIEIEVPDGKKAVWKDGKIVFKDIEFQLPKTWQEYCDRAMIDKNEVVIVCSLLDRPTVVQKDFTREPRNPFKHKILLPSKEVAKQFVALMQLYRLRDCYRQGWIPDEDDEKFIITVNYKEFYSVGKCINTKEFLAFQSREIAEEFLTNFQDLIKQAGDLI